MIEEMSRYAFPETAKVYWDSESEIDETKLEAAVRKDAMRMIESSWQHAARQKSSDPAVKLAVAMDASVKWSDDIRVITLKLNGEQDEEIEDDETELPLEEEIEATIDLALDEWQATQDPREVRQALLDVLQMLERFESDASGSPT